MRKKVLDSPKHAYEPKQDKRRIRASESYQENDSSQEERFSAKPKQVFCKLFCRE